MTNHPNRAQAPADLAGAIRADAEARGLSIRDWARAEGYSVTTVEQWLIRPPTGALGDLAAKGVAARQGG